MKLAWKQLAHKDEEKEADIKSALLEGRKALEFLAELIEERIDTERNLDERDNYDLENWALKRADTNGKIRAYKEILDLLGIDK